MEVRRFCLCRLPCRVEALGIYTFAAEEVHPPALRRVEVRCDRRDWNGKLGSPDSGGFVDRNPRPHAASDVSQPLRRDVQIKPLPAWTNLELLVILFPESICLQKDFRHIAIPKLISSPVGIGIAKDA